MKVYQAYSPCHEEVRKGIPIVVNGRQENNFYTQKYPEMVHKTFKKKKKCLEYCTIHGYRMRVIEVDDE